MSECGFCGNNREKKVQTKISKSPQHSFFFFPQHEDQREAVKLVLPTLPGGVTRTLSRVSRLILGDERFQGENLDRTLVCPLGISFLLKQRRFLCSRM